MPGALFSLSILYYRVHLPALEGIKCTYQKSRSTYQKHALTGKKKKIFVVVVVVAQWERMFDTASAPIVKRIHTVLFYITVSI